MIKLINPTGGIIRSDSQGDGHFGASRGSRIHNGIDLTLPFGPGQDILSPIKGEVIKHNYAYPEETGKTTYRGITIKSDRYQIKMLYLIPIVPIGEKVYAGDLVGRAQDISQRYLPENGDDAMTPHVHVEVRDISSHHPILLDPWLLFIDNSDSDH